MAKKEEKNEKKLFPVKVFTIYIHMLYEVHLERNLRARFKCILMEGVIAKK